MIIIFVLAFLYGEACFGQGVNSTESREHWQAEEVQELDDGDFSLGETLITLLVPRGVKDTWRLKRYVRSEKFGYLRAMVGDLRAIDEIYRRALEITNNDVSEALFICTLSTMEHRKVGIRLPLLNLPIYFPLTSEGDSVIRIRVSQLPSQIYVDSPPNEYGDKDKLQHFFGSAFLTYSFRFRTLAALVGDFVEWGEEEFIIDGVWDVRDRRANHQGREFGLAIGGDTEVKPSDFLQIQLVLSGSRTDW